MIGLVNLSWGVAAVIGPLAASAAHGHIDERVPFGIIAALCLARRDGVMLAGQRAPPAPSTTTRPLARGLASTSRLRA